MSVEVFLLKLGVSGGPVSKSSCSGDGEDWMDVRELFD